MKKSFNLVTGLVWLFLALFVLSACDNDPEPENEGELITTVILTFTKTDGTGSPITATWQDLDGPGGNDPIVSVPANLEADATYNMRIQVLNEQEDPVEDVTLEVEEEGDEHQFFFQVAGGLNLTIAYDDADEDGLPIGIENVVTTGAASSGTLTVILRHEPNKGATGVAAGNIANAGGDTDVETQPPFQISIQ